MFTSEEKDVIKILVINEMNYYEELEDISDIDIEYMMKLKEILKKLKK